MSRLILCRTEYSKRPFYVSGLGINVYSIEEICYYLYNNIYLVDAEFFNAEFFEFLEKDLGEKDLAFHLRRLEEEQSGLAEMILTVLQYVDYYTEEEINSIAGIIEKLDTQNAYERIKAMADNYLSSKRYSAAIKYYEDILNSQNVDRPGGNFFARVWHNMGVAYSRMMDYTAAANCFVKAVEQGGSTESRKAYFYAVQMLRTLEGIHAADSMEPLQISEYETEELNYETSHELETLLDGIENTREYSSVNTVFVLKKEGKIAEYVEEADKLISDWKKAYRYYTK